MIDVNFRYILKSNFDVEISGTVEIPNDEDASDDEFEITFEKEGGFTTSNIYIKHYGVDIKGRTDEQDLEIDKLKMLFCEDFLFLQRICDYAETNKILDLGETYLVINEADFELYKEEIL